jgi:chaperonin cofactor prefoldin
MTNPEQETRKTVAESAVTKIHGQPTNQDLERLSEELIAIASNIPSELGGGLQGHAGLIQDAATYDLIAPGTPFIFPANPGVYPQGNFPAAQRGQREAEHKAQVTTFLTCVGVSKGLKDLILKAVDEDYILELRAEGNAYLNVSPLQMLTHLRDRWGTMDFVDITALLAEMDLPWNVAEVPQIYFNRMDKARKQLLRANIQVDERAMMAKALKSFKDAGDFDPAIREWEVRPAAAQTYANLKTLMNTEFTKLNRQDATTARATGHASVNNVVEEVAQAAEELMAELTERQGKQVESSMKSITEALEKLTAAITANKPAASTGAAAAGNNKAAKAAAWAEKKRTATVCPHCDRKHPNRTHEQCWELPANASKRPADWKSVKST